MPSAVPADAETDGWLQIGGEKFRFLADDCKPLPPEKAAIVEKTVIRWMTEPAD